MGLFPLYRFLHQYVCLLKLTHFSFACLEWTELVPHVTDLSGVSFSLPVRHLVLTPFFCEYLTFL